jgi:hypothetical protein
VKAIRETVNVIDFHIQRIKEVAKKEEYENLIKNVHEELPDSFK